MKQRPIMPKPIIATYRLQFNPDFTFAHGANMAGYLCEIGASHLYASPVFQAVPGSTHGYDVVDPARTNEDLGGYQGFQDMVQALQNKDLGIILDVVPNHMSISSPLNRWWWDVLENGPASRFASHFDVDWEASEASPANRILLPVLGDHYGRVLGQGDIHIQRREQYFLACYFEHEFPLAPRSLVQILQRTAQRLGSEELTFLVDCLHNLPLPTVTDRKTRKRRHRNKEVIFRYLQNFLNATPQAAETVDAVLNELNKDPEALDHLLEQQNFRLCFWRLAGRDIGYRRFFDINTLVGLRVEDEEVFSDTHFLVLHWLNAGWLDGLRIDHPDGLRDPEQYFRRLRQYSSEIWILAEKILHPGEKLRPSWPIQGTTGYDFLNTVLHLLVDKGAEKQLTDTYAAFTGINEQYQEILESKKRLVLKDLFGSDVHRLCEVLRSICNTNRHYRDFTLPEMEAVIIELAVWTPVYRSYIRAESGQVAPEDQKIIQEVLTQTEKSLPDIDPDLLQLIRKILLLEKTGQHESEFVMRLQQLTAPVMAKGAEDTAFYCYNRFMALNEVGGDPGSFGLTPEEFHQTMLERMQTTPQAMSSTSTHDTKRSEDVRARLAVLSEIPERWSEYVHTWAERNKGHKTQGWPDPNLEYLLYQTMVGAWPLEEERLHAYAQKAAREAKTHTSWTRVNPEYEQSLHDFIQALYLDRTFVSELQTLVHDIEYAGYVNGLSQVLFKMICPGIPDMYQGTELWDFSLVDPDNRRPVDYSLRRKLLNEVESLSLQSIMDRISEGLPKLWLIRLVLHLRRQIPEAFGPAGSYDSLVVRGSKAAHAVAFVRGGRVISLSPRLPLTLADRWEDTVLDLPEGTWLNVLTSSTTQGGPQSVQSLLDGFPVGLFKREE
ncbi:MAG: malto-oligosyltrehalose synthase [Desulfovermiculus sp.]|nr:malto-oligosyltrehalose synthase [Desulfovermiculus sp.]